MEGGREKKSLDPMRHRQSHHPVLNLGEMVERTDQEEEEGEEAEGDEDYRRQQQKQQQLFHFPQAYNDPSQQRLQRTGAFLPFASSSATGSSSEHGHFTQGMLELHHEQQQRPRQQLLFHQPRPSANSRPGAVKGGGGEIVEVQGGYLVRSTGRKDRHSKVCTATGPRDRRVRLSAHTAIQFYDLQDRLGYDRPSKAVDWLIKKAKAAIDELAELPPWHPTTTTHPSITDLSKKAVVQASDQSTASSAATLAGSSDFLPPSLETDAIADTIKYFVPVASGAGAASSTAASLSAINPTSFHHCTPDIFSRSYNHAQDVCLSLQSVEDPPALLQRHLPQSASVSRDHPIPELAFFENSANWPDQNQRVLPQTVGGGSYMFSMPQRQQQTAIPPHPLAYRGPFLTQRGSLQSNNWPSILAWTDPTATANPGSSGFVSGGFSGFRVPARIQGEEEHDDSNSGEPSGPPVVKKRES